MDDFRTINRHPLYYSRLYLLAIVEYLFHNTEQYSSTVPVDNFFEYFCKGTAIYG